jgi:hypothetical protein
MDGESQFGRARSRFERVLDLAGFQVGIFNPSGPPPNLPPVQRRALFNVGVDEPREEEHDWTVYALPQLPEEWWFTVSDVLAYALQRAPFSIELSTGPGQETQRIDIPFQGIAFHVCASEFKLALRCDPGFFNIEMPPMEFEGRSIAVWARRGRPVSTWQTLSSGLNVQFANQVPTPKFLATMISPANGGRAFDRNGFDVSTLPASAESGVSWLAAEVGTIGGYFAGAPTMVGRIVR